VEYTVTYYRTDTGEVPVQTFLTLLKKPSPVLEKLLVAGLQKIRNSERHGYPLTEPVDSAHGIYELRVGKTNIARILFFFEPNQRIIATNGYVKKQQKADPTEVARARRYQEHWRNRHP